MLEKIDRHSLLYGGGLKPLQKRTRKKGVIGWGGGRGGGVRGAYWHIRKRKRYDNPMKKVHIHTASVYLSILMLLNLECFILKLSGFSMSFLCCTLDQKELRIVSRAEIWNTILWVCWNQENWSQQPWSPPVADERGIFPPLLLLPLFIFLSFIWIITWIILLNNMKGLLIEMNPQRIITWLNRLWLCASVWQAR